MISISSDLMIEKQMIRSKFLEKRRLMEKEDVLNKSRSIQHKLEKDPVFQTSKNILFYVSYGNEVYTHSLIKKYLEVKKQVLVPRSNKKFNKIDSVIITNWGDLKKGTYEILEPPIAYIPFANKIDLLDEGRWSREAVLKEFAIHNTQALLTSAKTGENVDTGFHQMGRNIISREL